jgi:hypothetical protein
MTSQQYEENQEAILIRLSKSDKITIDTLAQGMQE